MRPLQLLLPLLPPPPWPLPLAVGEREGKRRTSCPHPCRQERRTRDHQTPQSLRECHRRRDHQKAEGALRPGVARRRYIGSEEEEEEGQAQEEGAEGIGVVGVEEEQRRLRERPLWAVGAERGSHVMSSTSCLRRWVCVNVCMSGRGKNRGGGRGACVFMANENCADSECGCCRM